MSRKKMITFDSDEYLSQVKRRMKQKEDVCFERMAKLTNMKEDTVRSWFRLGRIPEYEKSILDIYLETGRKMKKVLPAPKKEEPAPEKDINQMTFDEFISQADVSVQVGGIEVDNIPVYHIDANVIEYPKAKYFIEHAFDRFGDLTPECRVAYLQCLAQILICDKEAR